MAGLGRVDQAKKRVEAKRKQRNFLTIDDGETVIMRFLEEGADFKDVQVHRVSMEGESGSTYFEDVPCLDQNSKGIKCPGCRDDVDIRYKFYVNVIVRDYPETNDAGKVIGERDQLMIWTGGVTVADKLAKKHKKYGLMSRDWEVTREGVKKKTTYDVEQASDKAEPLSDEDRKLMEGKHDLSWYVTPPDFDDFYLPARERGGNKDDDDDNGGGRRKKKANPWNERKKSGEKPRGMRTKSRSSKSSGDDSTKKTRVRSGSSKGTTRVRRRR